MSKVKADISVSLDGFVAGPNDSPENGLGDGGERLHEWVVGLESWRQQHGMSGGERNRDSEVTAETTANVGAFVMGRRMFDHGEGPWGDEPPFHMPVFVVTHRGREPLAKAGGTTFYFVTDGMESALRQARAAAGDKDVLISGGGNVIQQAVRARLLDEVQVHLVPVLLGGGRRLFEADDSEQMELRSTRVIESPTVTHLRYELPT